MIYEHENIIRVTEKVNEIISASQKSTFVVIDGDRTLIPTDSTLFFFDRLGLNFKELETIFNKDGYSYVAFHNAAALYSQINHKDYEEGCKYSGSSVSIYPEFLSFIDEVKHDVEFILVTSGLAQSWKNVLQNHSLNFFHLIGGNYFPTDNYIVDKNSKGVISKTIVDAGKIVYAFGDTMIDFEMLSNATNPYIVVNEKLNDDFVSSFNLIPTLQQVSFGEYAHQNLPLITLIEVAKTIKRN